MCSQHVLLARPGRQSRLSADGEGAWSRGAPCGLVLQGALWPGPAGAALGASLVLPPGVLSIPVEAAAPRAPQMSALRLAVEHCPRAGRRAHTQAGGWPAGPRATARFRPWPPPSWGLAHAVTTSGFFSSVLC